MKRLALLTATTLAAMLAFAGPALAHVTVSAPGATRGGSDQEITFRVPVEKNVDTVALTIALPTTTPIASVLIVPIDGWTHTQKTVKLAHPITSDDGTITSAVSQISWRATSGHGLAPGEFGAFTILAGQLPDTGTVIFRALQYYRDGSVTRWIQVAAPGSSAEPEDPAPVLHLAAATSSTPQRKATNSTSNTGPYVISIVALVLAAGALAVTVAGRVRSTP
jgi:uncharacterized protein YcnI